MKCKLKSQWDAIYIPTIKLKTRSVPNINENREFVKHPCVVSWSVKWHEPFGKPQGFLTQINRHLTQQLYSQLPRRNESLCPQIPNGMFTAALFKVVKHWQQTKHPSTREGVSKLWYTLPVDFQTIKKGGIVDSSTTWISLKNIMSSRQS